MPYEFRTTEVILCQLFADMRSWTNCKYFTKKDEQPRRFQPRPRTSIPAIPKCKYTAGVTVPHSSWVAFFPTHKHANKFCLAAVAATVQYDQDSEANYFAEFSLSDMLSRC